MRALPPQHRESKSSSTTESTMASQMLGSNVRLPTRSLAFSSQQPRTAVNRPSVGSNMHGSSSSSVGTVFGMPSASSSRTANRRVVTMAAKGKKHLQAAVPAFNCPAGPTSGVPCAVAATAAGITAAGTKTRCCLRRLAAAVTGKIKLELVAGKANPAPPVGPALGAKVIVFALFWGGGGEDAGES